MEEEKLLRFLIWISIFYSLSAIASREFVMEKQIEFNKILFEDLAKALAQASPEVKIEDLFAARVNLKIFVSSSMPKQALKVYAEQAKKYQGVLIIKGLPGGSFKELSRWVQELSFGEGVAMQIDDEAFEKFDVRMVPAIVLVKEKACYSERNCVVIFDKIMGQVGIEFALEEFKKSGDLEEEASQLLARNGGEG